jgi:hypothetical protein
MRKGSLLACFIFSAIAAGGAPPKLGPDAGKVADHVFESTFFRFHYQFPSSWVAVNDEVRMSVNRKRHEDAVEKARKNPPPPTFSGDNTITHVISNYDLLIATPSPLPEGKLAGLPNISIWARESDLMLNEAQAKIRTLGPHVKVLRKPEKITFGGHKFVRTDFVRGGDSYQVLFVTLIRGYQLGFEFWGKSESEINELAASMKDLQFTH